MSPEILVALSIAIFLVLILLEVPVGISIGIAGVLGIIMLDGTMIAGRILATAPYSATAKYALVVIPMYILLGTLIANSGIGADIYSAVNRAVRRLPGGLAAAAVIATSLFSGISGSSAADVATFGRISVNEMTKHGYSKQYAAAIMAAAGAFAALIPPSVTLVIYAIIAEQNVSAMIIAGVVPGIASATILVAFVVVGGIFGSTGMGGKRTTRKLADSLSEKLESAVVVNSGGGTIPGSSGVVTRTRVQRNRADALALLYAIIIFGIVVGGLYGGVFTPTESGAVGAFAALVITLIAVRGRTERGLGELLMRTLRETSSVSAMIFLLLIGGAIFTYLVASSRMPFVITEWVGQLEVEPWVVVAIFLVVLLILGTFLDGLSTLLLTVPLMAPVVDSLGFEGIWFGILVLKAIEIGLITPPVGINAYIIAGIAKVPVWPLFLRLIPFVALDIAVTATLFIFPDIILWLPRAAGLVS